MLYRVEPVRIGMVRSRGAGFFYFKAVKIAEIHLNGTKRTASGIPAFPIRQRLVLDISEVVFIGHGIGNLSGPLLALCFSFNPCDDASTYQNALPGEDPTAPRRSYVGTCGGSGRWEKVGAGNGVP